MSQPATRAARLPRGYLGGGHETIGSDIIAVFEAVLDVEQTLGSHWMPLVRTLDPHGWYSIDLLLTLGEVLADRVGPDAVRLMGEGIFKLSHESLFSAHATSVGDLVFGLDGMYRRANRGHAIGGWTVLEFTPQRARLEKTTPHPCLLDEGVIAAAFRTLGLPLQLEQPRCLRHGHDACEFLLEATVAGERWMGAWPRIVGSPGGS